MRGILYSDYKVLAECLGRLITENISAPQHSLHLQSLHTHKENLDEIYLEYKKLHREIVDAVKRFEEHKQSIKRLIILQKRINTKERIKLPEQKKMPV